MTKFYLLCESLLGAGPAALKHITKPLFSQYTWVYAVCCACVEFFLSGKPAASSIPECSRIPMKSTLILYICIFLKPK